MNNIFQTVHTVEDYYDGPRSGIADFGGQPHFYRSVYLDSPQWNDGEDRFELSPVTKEVLEAACELDAIFKRWNTKRRATPDFTYTEDEFGALPEERARYHELERFLELSYAEAAQACRILVHGKFRGCERTPSRLEVRWTLAEHGPAA